MSWVSGTMMNVTFYCERDILLAGGRKLCYAASKTLWAEFVKHIHQHGLKNESVVGLKSQKSLFSACKKTLPLLPVYHTEKTFEAWEHTLKSNKWLLKLQPWQKVRYLMSDMRQLNWKSDGIKWKSITKNSHCIFRFTLDQRDE